jgi:hypothetical protein
MSFDIVVLHLPESDGLVPSLEDVSETLPLGTPDEIRTSCDVVFPGLAWSTERFGLFKSDHGYAIEFSIPEDAQPTSLHLCLFFGPNWEGESSSSFDKSIERLHATRRWQSFAASDNSSLLLAEDEQ